MFGQQRGKFYWLGGKQSEEWMHVCWSELDDRGEGCPLTLFSLIWIFSNQIISEITQPNLFNNGKPISSTIAWCFFMMYEIDSWKLSKGTIECYWIYRSGTHDFGDIISKNLYYTENFLKNLNYAKNIWEVHRLPRKLSRSTPM